MFGLGPVELMIVGVIAVLLFGSRLPSVARSMGQSLVEFKKGMQGIEHEMHVSNAATPSPESEPSAPSGSEASTAPKFEPPTAEPKDV